MQHFAWHEDIYVPDYKPKTGDLIFTDLTLEQARAYRRRFVEKYWDDEKTPMRDHPSWRTKDEAVEKLAQDDVDRFAPHLEVFVEEFNK